MMEFSERKLNLIMIPQATLLLVGCMEEVAVQPAPVPVVAPAPPDPVLVAMYSTRPADFTEESCNAAVKAATEQKCGKDDPQSTLAERGRVFSCIHGLESMATEWRANNQKPHTRASIMLGCPKTGTYVMQDGDTSVTGCAGPGGKDE